MRNEDLKKQATIGPQAVDESGADEACFVVVAFRYGGSTNSFPIGVFSTMGKAERAAQQHREYRGGKYSHRIYEFSMNEWDDDIGHDTNSRPCIEEVRI